MENSTQSDVNISQSNLADIIQIPLFALIVILAGIYITIVLSRQILRSNKFNWLTVNICFTIIFFAFVQLFSTSVNLYNTTETVVLCRVKGFIVNMATCHIMYSHCTASFCRLLSIQYPHKLLFRSRYWLLSNISMDWLVGLLIALPYLFLDGFTCSPGNAKQFLQIYTSFSAIFMPITIVTVCNIAIFRHARQSSRRIHILNSNNNNNQMNKRDMHLCKVMLLTFGVFVIGWTPLFIEQILLNNGISLPTGVTTFLKILPSASLLADVILLIYSDQPVRNSFLKIFKCHGLIPCVNKS
jgi:hypothetical protein